MTIDYSFAEDMIFSFGLALSNLIGIIYFFKQVLKPKLNFKKTFLVWIIISIVVAILNGKRPLFQKEISGVLVMIITATVTVLLYQGRVRWKLFIFIIMQLIQVMAAIPFIFLMLILNITYREYWNDSVLLAVANLICLNSMLIPGGIIIKRILNQRKNLSGPQIKEICILAVLNLCEILVVTILLIQLLNIKEEGVIILSVLLMFLLISGLFFLPWLVLNMLEVEKHESELFLLLQKSELSNEYLRESEEYNNRIEQLSTKMKIILDKLLYLIENDKTKEAYQLIEKNFSSITSIKRPFISNNFIVDYLIGKLQTQCEEANIKLETDITVPSKFGIEEIELCTILSNIIDNALKANIASSEKRSINIQIHLNNNVLYISCKNRKPEIWEKDTKRKHFGMTNIQDIVEKYNGTINIQNKSNSFQIEIILFCPIYTLTNVKNLSS